MMRIIHTLIIENNLAVLGELYDCFNVKPLLNNNAGDTVSKNDNGRKRDFYQNYLENKSM